MKISYSLHTDRATLQLSTYHLNQTLDIIPGSYVRRYMYKDTYYVHYAQFISNLYRVKLQTLIVGKCKVKSINRNNQVTQTIKPYGLEKGC